MNIFISHSSVDREEALETRRILEGQDRKVWLDAFNLHPAESLEGQLTNNIKEAEILCLLLSPVAVASKWVLKEIGFALEESKKRKLKIVPIILRPCKIPEEIKGLAALRVFDVYQGLKSELIRLRLIKAVMGDMSVLDAKLDEAYCKYQADLAEQEKAMDILPQKARNLDPVRERPIQNLTVELATDIFDDPTYAESPYIIELRLNLNTILSQPISFFFAPFKEGSTWTEGFDFTEPPYTAFHPDQPRINAKFKWYDRTVDLIANTDGTELGGLPAAFNMIFDGKEFRPQEQPFGGFQSGMSPLARSFQIPSLKELTADGSHFEIVIHIPSTQTARSEDRNTDIDIRVTTYFSDEKINMILFKSRHSELEKIVLAGNYLSNINSPIERETLLGFYPAPDSTRDKQLERLRIHKLLMLRDVSEIEWPGDKRLIARLLDGKLNVFGRRKQTRFLFNWDEFTADDEIRVRNFLADDFVSQQYFSYLVFNNAKEIDNSIISKAPEVISISTPNVRLYIRLIESRNTAGIFLIQNGKEYLVHSLQLSREQGKLKIYMNNQLDVYEGCEYLRQLLGPIIFEGVPVYKDAYLFLKASDMLTRQLMSLSEFKYAREYAAVSLSAAEKMLALYPDEQDYSRQRGRALILISEVELAAGQPESGIAKLTQGINVFRTLYAANPNSARLNDLYKTLEFGRKLMDERQLIKHGLYSEIGPELRSLEETRLKVLNFGKDLSLNLGSVRFDVVEKIIDNSDISKGTGTLNGKEKVYIKIKLKSQKDPSTWKDYNKVFQRNGFKWTRILGTERDEFWEKWQEPDTDGQA